ncbi:MAG: ABC transporter substrate-binding protein [Alphaproteobacteria bacterium]|nr:ABC transporter substrate-binding protein [Alphaproteobacteria bacterium]
MKTTRRNLLKGGLAAATTATMVGYGPKSARAQRRNEARYVPHADLRVLDPIWTTANISAYHGAMIYDTLFGIDANLNPQPQMVGQYNLSDDRKTHTFVLRDGLRWDDNTPVTSADCVASMLRWKARDGAGQHMWQRVTDLSAVDEKTFKLVLREPYGLVLEALAKTSTPLCYIMKKEIAETDPNTQITRHIGCGPFKFVESEYRPGTRVVYEKNPNYVPRSEPASGIAGGKRVHLDRVIWDIMPDAQTAASALMAGEVEFYEVPPIDIVPALQAAPGVKIEVLSALGNVGYCRLNHLHPPFNNVLIRRAAQLAVNQEDFLRAAIGNPQYYRVCGSHFTCGSPMGVEDGSEMLNQPMPARQARARELLREGGYNNMPVVVLHATDIPVMNQAAQVIAQNLRQIGMNVILASSDWGGVVTRRSVKDPPVVSGNSTTGGWNIFFTWGGGNSTASPINLFAHAATGQNAWFGWPENALNEQLRNEWAAAPDLATRRAVAQRLNRNMFEYVHDIKTGQWFGPAAYRSDRLRGVLPVPEIGPPWWNIERIG